MSLTIRQIQAHGSELGLDSLDRDVLICAVLQKPRTHLIAWPEKELPLSVIDSVNGYFSRRLTGEPVAYITGVREFWSLPLKTNAETLIPRPDTEVLVETVLSVCSNEPRVCVDLGTGTGAIALALKSEQMAWRISGVDRMPGAIKLATENAAALRLDVDFQLSSWCDSIPPQSVDILVSNPPYIDSADHHLNEGDVRFEPVSALVADNHGLSDIETIAHQATNCLTQHGLLFLEHGWQQADDVQMILRRRGFVDISTVKDYGNNDRVTYGRLNTPIK